MTKRKWQHVVPQKEPHHIIPYVEKKTTGVNMRCSECGKKIKLVPENDGPESLKAMFPL